MLCSGSISGQRNASRVGEEVVQADGLEPPVQRRRVRDGVGAHCGPLGFFSGSCCFLEEFCGFWRDRHCGGKRPLGYTVTVKFHSATPEFDGSNTCSRSDAVKEEGCQ